MNGLWFGLLAAVWCDVGVDGSDPVPACMVTNQFESAKCDDDPFSSVYKMVSDVPDTSCVPLGSLASTTGLVCDNGNFSQEIHILNTKCSAPTTSTWDELAPTGCLGFSFPGMPPLPGIEITCAEPSACSTASGIVNSGEQCVTMQAFEAVDCTGDPEEIFYVEAKGDATECTQNPHTKTYFNDVRCTQDGGFQITTYHSDDPTCSGPIDAIYYMASGACGPFLKATCSDTTDCCGGACADSTTAEADGALGIGSCSIALLLPLAFALLLASAGSPAAA